MDYIPVFFEVLHYTKEVRRLEHRTTHAACDSFLELFHVSHTVRIMRDLDDFIFISPAVGLQYIPVVRMHAFGYDNFRLLLQSQRHQC